MRHGRQEFRVLFVARGGSTHVPDAPLILELAQRRHQLVDTVHDVDLQQVHGVGAEPTECLGHDLRRVLQCALDRCLGGEEHVLAGLQFLQDAADHELGIAVRAGRVDHLCAELDQPRDHDLALRDGSMPRAGAQGRTSHHDDCRAHRHRQEPSLLRRGKEEAPVSRGLSVWIVSDRPVTSGA